MPQFTHSEAVRRLPWRRVAARVAACLAIICLAAHLAGRFRAPVSISTTVQINSAKAKVQHLENDTVRWFPPAAGAVFLLSANPAPRLIAEHERQVSAWLGECLYKRPPPRA